MISFVMTVDLDESGTPILDIENHSDRFHVIRGASVLRVLFERRDDGSQHKAIAKFAGTTPGGKAVFVGVGTRKLLQGLNHLDSTKLKRLKDVTGSQRTALLGMGIKAHVTTGVLLPPIIWQGQNINMYAEIPDEG